MILSPDPTAPETLSLLDIAAWQFKDLAVKKTRIIAGIPSIQRGAVWNAGQVELLWDSIFRGFPIGSLVVCQKLTTQKTHSGKYGSGWDEEDFTRHLLDGQQRCNAIALGFLNALKCSGKNENRIYNVEHLFQRLNSGGTELRGEELAFSMIKAYWPGIEQSFSAIRDKHGNSCLPMPGSRLPHLVPALLSLTLVNMQAKICFPRLWGSGKFEVWQKIQILKKIGSDCRNIWG